MIIECARELERVITIGNKRVRRPDMFSWINCPPDSSDTPSMQWPQIFHRETRQRIWRHVNAGFHHLRFNGVIGLKLLIPIAAGKRRPRGSKGRIKFLGGLDKERVPQGSIR